MPHLVINTKIKKIIESRKDNDASLKVLAKAHKIQEKDTAYLEVTEEEFTRVSKKDKYIINVIDGTPQISFSPEDDKKSLSITFDKSGIESDGKDKASLVITKKIGTETSPDTDEILIPVILSRNNRALMKCKFVNGVFKRDIVSTNPGQIIVAPGRIGELQFADPVTLEVYY